LNSNRKKKKKKKKNGNEELKIVYLSKGRKLDVRKWGEMVAEFGFQTITTREGHFEI
jgi:hypothetical protein